MQGDPDRQRPSEGEQGGGEQVERAGKAADYEEEHGNVCRVVIVLDNQGGADEGEGEYGEELHGELHYKPIDEEPAEHKGKRVPDAGTGIVADDKENQQQRTHGEH